MRCLLILPFMLPVLVALFTGFPLRAEEQGAEAAARICANATRDAEQAHRIPRHLLFAISLKETGRWDAGRAHSYAWPWTVTSADARGGKGRYFPDRAAAVAEVRRLLDEGITNIDVGCMQINLRYHANAFENLEEAFDPGRNAEYAARFLVDLKQRHGSWHKATERYHSGNGTRGRNYRHAVSRLQQKVRKGEGVAMPDIPAPDNGFADRAAGLAADAAARRERQELAAAERAAAAARQFETAAETARRLRDAFENRKARRLAAWQEVKAKRRAAAARSN